MSTRLSIHDNSVPSQKVSTVFTKKTDRGSLCECTFADGRQCRTPRCSGHLHLCYFHAEKEAKALAAKKAGAEMSDYFSMHHLSACALSGALTRLFTAVAQGQVKPKTAMALAYVAQTMNQTIALASREYCESFGEGAWRTAIYKSYYPPSHFASPSPARRPSAPPAPSAPTQTQPLPQQPSQTSPQPPPGSGSADFSLCSLHQQTPAQTPAQSPTQALTQPCPPSA